MRSRAARIAGLLLAASLLSTRARASYEEFQTFDVAREEEDDESLLDHVLVQMPPEWREEWRTAKNAFRTSEGCFTAGRWYLDHDLKVQVPMGDTTYMALGIRDVSDDESTYDWTRFDVRFPIARTGLWGMRFSPTFDKSRQDVGFLWDHGTEATPLHIQVVMGMEDMFNRFWSLRQTRVGEDAEPYLRHPYEPALHVAWRGAGPHAEVNVKYLTPSVKSFDTNDPSLRRRETLWGIKHDATLAGRAGLYTGLAHFELVQASSFADWNTVPGDHHLFRRRWRGEGSFGREVGEHARVMVRFFYEDRTEVFRPPLGNMTLRVLDRLPMIEGSFRLPRGMGGRAGLMCDRISVFDRDLPVNLNIPGTRYERRAFFSLQKRFGRVSIQGTEGIELDKEPYPVTFHHDKGFVHIQTTF